MRHLLLPLVVSGLMAADLTITPDHADGVYKAGETVTWTINGGSGGDGPAYTVHSGGLTETAKGKLSFADGKATVSVPADKPGSLLLTLKVNGKEAGRGGAAVAWDQVAPSAPEPADFDAFWKAKVDELKAVPPDVTLEEVESGSQKVRLWKVTMANIRGGHIHGYLARPKEDGPCPAMLVVQWAGVYGLDKWWSVIPAKAGWMTLNILPHDLPVDESKDFYKQQADGPLKDYIGQGADDRDKYYFLRVFLACYRAADYLVGRPDWNGKTLLVQGGSQGGMQAIATAGLHPAVTMVTAVVPAGGDQTGVLAGRANGWPNILGNSKDAAREARLKTAPYFDTVNFAARVRAKTLIGLGLVDGLVPPTSVFAMYNRLNVPKRIVIMPTEGHMGAHAAYNPVMNAWWGAAKDGQEPPLQ